MKPTLIGAVLLLVVACLSTTNVSAREYGASSDPDLDTLVAWMEGDFSSELHSQKDTAYAHIVMHVRRIWQDSDEGAWFYVEQGLPYSESKPYRQRVYHIQRVEEGMIESAVYAIPQDSLFIGAWKDVSVFETLEPSDLMQKIGCEVYLQATGVSYIGGTHGTACRSSMSGATYTTSQVKIYADKIISWDQGFDNTDRQVWGAERGGYWFFRQ